MNKDELEHRGKEGAGWDNATKQRTTRGVEASEGSRACDKRATVGVRWPGGDN